MNPLHLLCLFCLSGSLLFAEIRVPSLFGNHMILQQETGNAIWGFGKPGEAVKVTASWGASAETTTGKDGRWQLILDTPSHATGHELTISGDNEIAIKDVAIGEVWFCSGQSNMGWALRQTFGGEAEAASATVPNFRIYRKAREHWHEPLMETRDRLAAWAPCTPESAAATSAVSYYFGKTLHDELDIPVGIIVSAFAGTPIEGWIPWELQADDPRALAHKQRYDDNAARQKRNPNETREAALAAHAKELAAYNAAIDAGDIMKNPSRERSPPIITKPADLGHQYPAHMYNGMINPLMPYGIRGMIWYQGERNAKNVAQAAHYEKQLPVLIQHLRRTWHHQSGGNVSDSFPFYFTQLPSWNPPQTQPVEGLEGPWAVSREAMRQVARQVPQTGMAVSIDTGDAIELHPKNKRPIGIRHGLLALKRTYLRDVVDTGPRLRAHRVEGGSVVLEFDAVGGGLVVAREGKLDAFAIAGSDRKWHWAEAKIDGARIVVSSAKVAEPQAVRYAWAMNPSQRNLLYNSAGLPASPFRTDAWPLFEAGTENDLPEVPKPKKPAGYEAKDWARPQMAIDRVKK